MITIAIETHPQCSVVATLCQAHDCDAEEFLWKLIRQEAMRLALANSEAVVTTDEIGGLRARFQKEVTAH